MKRLLPILLSILLLCGCGAPAATEPVVIATQPVQPPQEAPVIPETPEIPYESRFSSETTITLSNDGVKSAGPNSMNVFSSNDIIYYEDKDTYASGNPYGEGKDADKHTAEEATKHTVVNITAPGAYRVTGQLSYGQIRIDLGDNAYDDKSAVVELILDNADITCTVAPAILFMNVYECDGNWSEDTASADVDTSAAGANLILNGKNTVTGAYVAKIFKDKDGEKKLWKQDGAIYSYMSMNVYGPGALTLNADNEGMDTELHLTINGGDITILSGNDGINTNEDNVSVTTINAGTVHIVAGLGEEGDGIDSNGYLVINGGTVISAAKPVSDSGLDSDRGSYIHGGMVIAFGAAMDWAETESSQVTMNLQFSQRQKGALQVTTEDGAEVFSFNPATDPVLKDYDRGFQGAVISAPSFKIGDSYLVYSNGAQMQYFSTDVMRGPGGFGGQMPGGKGQRPEGMELPEGFDGKMPAWGEGEMPSMPEGFQGGQRPEGFQGGERPDGFGKGSNRGDRDKDRQPPEGFEGQMPNGEMPAWPEGEIPEGFEGFKGEMPEGFNGQRPEGFGGNFPGGFGGQGNASGEGQTVFYMQDKVNFFSGLTAIQ